MLRWGFGDFCEIWGGCNVGAVGVLRLIGRCKMMDLGWFFVGSMIGGLSVWDHVLWCGMRKINGKYL